jgi:hypothetical protein
MDVLTVQAFIKTAPWEKTSRGMMVTCWMQDEAISPECIPKGVRVDSVMWWRRAPNGLVPVRLVKKQARKDEE